MGNTACCQEQNRAFDSQYGKKIQKTKNIQPRLTNIIQQSPSYNYKKDNFLNISKQEEYPLDGHSVSYILDHFDSHENGKNNETLQKSLKQNKKNEQQILIPELSKRVNATLNKQKFFNKQLPEKPVKKRFQQQFYEGSLNQKGQPHGWGKFYKSDRSLYIGQFFNGKAQGKGALIFNDGSYYRGQFKANRAETLNGQFKSQDFIYRGGFKNNMFDGKGYEQKTNYNFQGTYKEGHKLEGQMKWKDNDNLYIYQGPFVMDAFQGKGRLLQPQGQYTGQFHMGLRHGKGIYKYQNGLRYEGDYVKGVKQGLGKIYNAHDKVAYQGQFQNGMPHGKGYIYNKNNKKVQSTWQKGIDKQLI